MRCNFLGHPVPAEGLPFLTVGLLLPDLIGVALFRISEIQQGREHALCRSRWCEGEGVNSPRSGGAQTPYQPSYVEPTLTTLT